MDIIHVKKEFEDRGATHHVFRPLSVILCQDFGENKHCLDQFRAESYI